MLEEERGKHCPEFVRPTVDALHIGKKREISLWGQVAQLFFPKQVGEVCVRPLVEVGLYVLFSVGYEEVLLTHDTGQFFYC